MRLCKSTSVHFRLISSPRLKPVKTVNTTASLSHACLMTLRSFWESSFVKNTGEDSGTEACVEKWFQRTEFDVHGNWSDFLWAFYPVSVPVFCGDLTEHNIPDSLKSLQGYFISNGSLSRVRLSCIFKELLWELWKQNRFRLCLEKRLKFSEYLYRFPLGWTSCAFLFAYAICIS